MPIITSNPEKQRVRLPDVPLTRISGKCWSGKKIAECSKPGACNVWRICSAMPWNWFAMVTSGNHSQLHLPRESGCSRKTVSCWAANKRPYRKSARAPVHRQLPFLAAGFATASDDHARNRIHVRCYRQWCLFPSGLHWLPDTRRSEVKS